ncbi:MAG: T9SS type A sorting domain-containing protein [Bacteroidetes bacterium]|nr:T9SS type A sorting domain-containing protein [Bacteroidota bacterium]
MKNGSAQTSCEVFAAGEVEDYGVSMNTITSIDENSSVSSSIYPNPVTTVLKADMKSGSVNTVRIVSLTGSIVNEFHFVSGTFVMDVNDLVAGIYFMEVTNENGVKAIENLCLLSSRKFSTLRSLKFVTRALMKKALCTSAKNLVILVLKKIKRIQLTIPTQSLRAIIFDYLIKKKFILSPSSTTQKHNPPPSQNSPQQSCLHYFHSKENVQQQHRHTVFRPGDCKWCNGISDHDDKFLKPGRYNHQSEF